MRLHENAFNPSIHKSVYVRLEGVQVWVRQGRRAEVDIICPGIEVLANSAPAAEVLHKSDILRATGISESVELTAPRAAKIDLYIVPRLDGFGRLARTLKSVIN